MSEQQSPAGPQIVVMKKPFFELLVNSLMKFPYGQVADLIEGIKTNCQVINTVAGTTTQGTPPDETPDQTPPGDSGSGGESSVTPPDPAA